MKYISKKVLFAALFLITNLINIHAAELLKIFISHELTALMLCILTLGSMFLLGYFYSIFFEKPLNTKTAIKLALINRLMAWAPKAICVIANPTQIELFYFIARTFIAIAYYSFWVVAGSSFYYKRSITRLVSGNPWLFGLYIVFVYIFISSILNLANHCIVSGYATFIISTLLDLIDSFTRIYPILPGLLYAIKFNRPLKLLDSLKIAITFHSFTYLFPRLPLMVGNLSTDPNIKTLSLSLFLLITVSTISLMLSSWLYMVIFKKGKEYLNGISS